MIPVKSKSPKIWLDIPLCENIYTKFRDLQAQKNLGEQIPPLHSRYPGKLESLIESVKLKSDLLDYDVYTVGACYYVNLARSQVFFNGNKRMSVVLTDLFFDLNGYKSKDLKWIDYADLTLLVSEDKKGSSEEIIELIQKIFREIYL